MRGGGYNLIRCLTLGEEILDQLFVMLIGLTRLLATEPDKGLSLGHITRIRPVP